MRSPAPPLLPIFRSQAQAEILAWLYLHPDQAYSLSELARHTGATLPMVHREAGRLAEAGLVTDTRRGRERLLQANAAHPAAKPLAHLLEITFGPQQVVAEEFGHVSGANKVLIFGSWASRYRGEPGHSPHDIDVLVVGDTVNRADVYAAADRAEARLGLPVNPTMRTNAEWDDPTDRLSSEIRRRSYLEIGQAT